MDDLGLDELTDDQLVELARAIAAEIALREAPVYQAARAATFDARKETWAGGPRAKAGVPSYDWPVARRAALMIEETLGTGWAFTVWKGRDGERRVYLDRRASGRRVSAVRAMHRPQQGALPDGEAKVTFYSSGSIHHPPGELKMEGVSADHSRVTAIVHYLDGAWDVYPSTPTSRAIASAVGTAPSPPYYQ